jgi:hypothetical protein
MRNVKTKAAPAIVAIENAGNVATIENLPAVIPAPVAAETPAPAPKPLSARAIALQAHDAAGFTGTTYAGLSKPRNSGITKAANIATSKATARTFAQLTERMHKALSELAKAYGESDFPTIGIDRGQLAIFINSGFIVATGEARGKLSDETFARYK